MCTVSLVRTASGFRLLCNRDERRTRTPALPPRVRESCGRRMLYPVDPDSGGTWIGVNDAGIAACLLNANPSPAGGKAGLRSRGEIVPALLHARSLDDAVLSALALDVRAFPPYRLLLADAQRSIVVGTDGRSRPLAESATARTPALMLTSSSLGDHLVEGPRRALFNLLFAAPKDPRQAQDVFHRHRWKDQPHLSVSMRRAEARTVSRTAVDLTAGRFTMTYTPLAEDGSPSGGGLELGLQRASTRATSEAVPAGALA